MKEHLLLLGFKVKDAVTGFEGVLESISFDLYGCVQAIVKPGLDDKGIAAGWTLVRSEAPDSGE